jgi:hypothetical protein
MIGPVIDVDHWLRTNGIKRKWAEKIAIQVKKEYPFLGKLIKKDKKDTSSNRAELDLVLLVHHVMQGRFPVESGGKRPVGSSV